MNVLMMRGFWRWTHSNVVVEPFTGLSAIDTFIRKSPHLVSHMTLMGEEIAAKRN